MADQPPQPPPQATGAPPPATIPTQLSPGHIQPPPPLPSQPGQPQNPPPLPNQPSSSVRPRAATVAGNPAGGSSGRQQGDRVNAPTGRSSGRRGGEGSERRRSSAGGTRLHKPCRTCGQHHSHNEPHLYNYKDEVS